MHRLITILVIFGVTALMALYLVLTEDPLRIKVNGQDRMYIRAEHPQLFTTSALASAVLALLFFGGALYIHFGLGLRRAPPNGPLGLSWFAIVMVGLGLIGILAAVLAGVFQ